MWDWMGAIQHQSSLHPPFTCLFKFNVGALQQFWTWCYFLHISHVLELPYARATFKAHNNRLNSKLNGTIAENCNTCQGLPLWAVLLVKMDSLDANDYDSTQTHSTRWWHDSTQTHSTHWWSSMFSQAHSERCPSTCRSFVSPLGGLQKVPHDTPPLSCGSHWWLKCYKSPAAGCPPDGDTQAQPCQGLHVTIMYLLGSFSHTNS